MSQNDGHKSAGAHIKRALEALRHALSHLRSATGITIFFAATVAHGKRENVKERWSVTQQVREPHVLPTAWTQVRLPVGLVSAFPVSVSGVGSPLPALSHLLLRYHALSLPAEFDWETFRGKECAGTGEHYAK